MLTQPLREVMTRWALRMRRPGGIPGRRVPSVGARPSVITVVRPRLEEMEVRLAPAALIAPTPTLATAVGGATSGTNVFNNSTNNVARADYSSPIVAANPVNTLQQVMVTQSSRISDGLLGVTIQVTTDGGQNWNSLGTPAGFLDTTSADVPLRAFPNTSQGSVTFGRDGIFYVSYVQHTALPAYAAGVVVVESYSFFGTPAARSIVSLQNQTLNGGSVTQQIIYRWSNGQDAAYNPAVAVDSNLGSYTEPGGATFRDTLVDPATGAPKAVYVAYNTVGTEPTGDDSASSGAQGRFFNPNAVWASVSTDQLSRIPSMLMASA